MGAIKLTTWTMDLTDSFETKYIKYFTLLVVGGLVLTLTVVVLFDNSDQYTLITRDTVVSGRISNIDREHGMLYFNIQDSLKYKVSGHMANYEYSQGDLFFFLTDGDWLEKRSGTDTLSITRSVTTRRTENYIFVLEQELNKELRKTNE